MMRSNTQMAGVVALAGIIAVGVVTGPQSVHNVSAQGGPANGLAQRVARLEALAARQQVVLDELAARLESLRLPWADLATLPV